MMIQLAGKPARVPGPYGGPRTHQVLHPYRVTFTDGLADVSDDVGRTLIAARVAEALETSIQVTQLQVEETAQQASAVTSKQKGASK